MEKRIDALLCLYLALMLLILPLNWTFAAVLAAILHELGHYVAVRLCGGKLRKLRASIHGAVMEAVGVSPVQELICILAGPAVSLSMLLLAPWFPRIAICGGMQGLFNLLPVYSLDGGRAARCLCGQWMPQRIGHCICAWLEKSVLAALLMLGFYGSFCLRLGIMPLLVSIYVCCRAYMGKRPCKPGKDSVQ